MKKNLTFLAMVMLFACNNEEKPTDDVLYQSEAFTVYSNKVVQGSNVAEVVSPTHIKSNYKSPASESYSRLIIFKFSINEKDNELPPGKNHWVIVGEENESSVVKFGEEPPPAPENPGTFLPTNYEYTFKVDVSSIFDQFKEKGYFETYDGNKVAESDFKGIYIAGGSEPLTWDFVNLDNQGLKLQPTDEDGIYSITLLLNPYNEADYEDKEWQLSVDINQRPKYTSDQPLIDALFNLSLEEATLNIEDDSTFRTGAKWGGVWTRDISYSIYLAFAYHEPEVAKISLRKKIKRDRVIQDTGSGGAWPVSSDRTTWVLAAWEIYKATGDQDWLEEIYPIIKNTLDDDYKTIFDEETGLYSGESSFLDWREQTYPKWMSNMDIYVSQNLGTNVVHFQAHQILAKIAALKGEDGSIYQQRADQLKQGINEHFWIDDRGYYAQFLYGRPYLVQSPRFEALGEALSILFDVADEQKGEAIISKSPVTAFGTTCIYPQIPGIPPYHNNGIWPFVQSYWNIAAAKTGNEAVLNHGLASIYRAAGLFLTNYENIVGHTGDFLGTEINSHRMLWSMAGNLAMVHRVFMGMNFEENGLRFSPAVPQNYGGTRTLSNFKYRDATLAITVKGYGNKIRSFKVDGNEQEPFIDSGIQGEHTIEIELDNTTFEQSINLVENKFSLPTVQASLDGNTINWESIEGAVKYNIYLDGKLASEVKTSGYAIDTDDFAIVQVAAVDENGYEGFSSEPIHVNASSLQFEAEQFAAKSELPYSNYSGDGFIEISNDQNQSITLNISVEEAGEYLLDMRYSNGSGPWNTDNKCAIRSLYQNDQYVGAFVFPQRGKDEWSDWGYSNSRVVNLFQGNNQLKLVFDEWSNNMNVDVNKAMIDHIRLLKL